MKKYFGNRKNFTLDELKTIVANNPQLGFYFKNHIICPITGTITIHNWNNGNNGKLTRTFYLQPNESWESNN
jgi:hypothetical protein